MQSSSTCICYVPVILTCEKGLSHVSTSLQVGFCEGSLHIYQPYFVHPRSHIPHFSKQTVKCFLREAFSTHPFEICYGKTLSLSLKSDWVKQWFPSLFLTYASPLPNNILCRSWIHKIEAGCSVWSSGGSRLQSHLPHGLCLAPCSCPWATSREA